MRKSILSSVLALLLILILVLSGVAVAKWSSAFRALQVEAKTLRAEREALLAKLKDADELAAHLVAQSSSAVTTDGSDPNLQLSQSESSSTHSLNLWRVRPDISTNSAGKKSYFFGELYGADNQVIARDAQFEELLGFTKLAFRTSKGTRYYDLDDLHPEVIRSLGYDATVLKRRLAEEARQRQLLAAQAQHQAELRVKAATELAEREKAASERIKAEAALRDAEARERLAEAAERNATNPPRERVIQKVVVVSPYSRVITNAPPNNP